MQQDITRIHYAQQSFKLLKYERMYIMQIDLDKVNLEISELMRLCNKISGCFRMYSTTHMCGWNVDKYQFLQKKLVLFEKSHRLLRCQLTIEQNLLSSFFQLHFPMASSIEHSNIKFCFTSLKSLKNGRLCHPRRNLKYICIKLYQLLLLQLFVYIESCCL